MTFQFQSALNLPELLLFDSGEPVDAAAQWSSRREEVRSHILPLVYGELWPTPKLTQGIELHCAISSQFAGARLVTLRVEVESRHAFLVQVFVPEHEGRLPVVVSGDGCWHYATDQVIAEILKRNYAFAQFNRVEVAPDPRPETLQKSGIEATGGQGSAAAIACWAWAYHRAVDVLLTQDFVDPEAIAVVGHSRGGKAALLAGATDQRIALTCANNSGAGGAGSFRNLDPAAETLGQLMDRFPHWLNPALRAYIGREQEMPCDQHFLKALVAPRALLTTEARSDVWANPSGTWQTHLAASKVYDLLGVSQNIACIFREGGHTHSYEDWCAMLDFADRQFASGAP